MLPPQVAQLDLCVPYQSTVPETPSGITETSTSHLLEPSREPLPTATPLLYRRQHRRHRELPRSAASATPFLPPPLPFISILSPAPLQPAPLPVLEAPPTSGPAPVRPRPLTCSPGGGDSRWVAPPPGSALHRAPPPCSSGHAPFLHCPQAPPPT